MASSGNTNPNIVPNQQAGVSSGGGGGGGGGGFDMNTFFKPATLPPPPAASSPSYAAAVAAAAAGAISFAPSASFPPPSGQYSFPPQTPPYYHPHPHMPNFPPQDHHVNLLPQRSVSFPVPPLQPVPNSGQSPNPNPNPNSNPNHGARLMAMLTPPPNFEFSNHPPTPMPTALSAPTGLQPSSSAEFLMPQSGGVQQMVPVPGPTRMPSSKLPRGRHLVGDRMVYDVEARLPGEEQPQLEVTPITKYVSDPGLILGHQIAVSKTYICYGLKMGNIRVLNINTALRSLLRGHTQRVTDMAFFAEDVHLLASASIEGRVCVWKISEGPDDEGKPQISGHVVLAIHITSDDKSIHPRVCWHCHKQEILVVAIGKNIFRIDTLKLCKGTDFSAEEPLLCPVDKLVDGVQLVGKHDGEVTDLSMCQWMTTRLVSASKDGTIKIWEDRKALPLLELKPHDGQPVDAAKFLSSPHQLGHIILITAGPLNREVKLWASSGDEGWLLPSDAESWRCTQTLELKRSGELRNEDVFFNQVVALSQAGLLLLANAKKNAIYAIHLEYGANPAATHMDYLAEFTVTMPILSFTGTSDVSPHGEHQVQVYCVQTQAIQQYALDISQCLPPPIEMSGIEKSESSVSLDTVNLPRHNPSESKSSEAPHSTPGPSNDVSVPEVSSETNAAHELNTSYMDSAPTSLLSASSITGISPVAPPPLPLSPRLSRKASDIRSDHTFSDYPVDRQMDSPQTSSSSMLSFNDDNRTTQGNSSDVSQPAMFQRPTHLVKPSEFMPISSADTTRAMETSKKESKNQAEEMSNDSSNAEVEIKVVGEAGISRSVEPVHPIDHTLLSERNEKSFYSQASDLGVDMTREFCATPSQPSIVEEAKNSILEALSQPSHSGDEEDEVSNDVSPTPVSEGKKLTERNSQESAEISQGSITGSSIQSFDTAFQHIVATAETLKEMIASMKEVQEMQKQMSATVAAPVTKEGRRLEAAVSRCVEKATKANADALWARMQEEMAKHEKLIRDRSQQITGSLLKEFPPVLERVLKKEIAALGTNITRAVIPTIEKTISAAITESFQRGVGDKAASQLEKSVTSKLEPTVARHIQAQFQTSGKQALQDGLKSCVEASIIPAFEATCKAMFDQIDVALQKGIVEHTQAAQHQVETNHSQLALALRDSLSSASSLTQSLSGEIADGHRKLLALAAAGAKSNSGNQLVTQLSNGPLAGLHEKVDLDPTKELSRLISEHKYEEAFTSALQRSDVSIVSWLCSQVDLQRMLTLMPLPLSQGVLLSLLQQLACDITKDTTRKLGWMMDVASCIVPHDPMIAVHARPILEQVYQILNHQRSLPTTTPAEISSIRVIMHVINSMLMAYK